MKAALLALAAGLVAFAAWFWFSSNRQATPPSPAVLCRFLESHEGIGTLAFSPHSKQLATSAFREIELWDVPTGKLQRTLVGHTDGVKALAYTADGTTLLSAGNDKTIRLWNVTTGLESARLTGHRSPITCLAISPDNKLVATGSCADVELKLWDLSAKKELADLEGHRQYMWIDGVAFSPDNQFLASASMDKTVIIWRCKDGRPQHVLDAHTGDVTAVAFSPDGKLLATGSKDTTVRLWDTASWLEKHVLQVGNRWIRSLAFSRDGDYLVVGSDSFKVQPVQIWDIRTIQKIKELHGHRKTVMAVAFSPDGSTLVTSGLDQTAILWHWPSVLKTEGDAVHAERPTSAQP